MLKDEIRAGESASLEFKRDVPKDHLRYLKTVVAFANGSGGRIVFGVDDDRTVVGMDEFAAFKIADGIVDTISNRCKPLIAVNTEVTSVDGKTVIIVEVQNGKRCPYFVQSLGKEEGSFVRVGATTRLADEVTIRELEFAGAGRSFDEEICPGLEIAGKDVAKLCARMFRVAKENCKTDAERRALRKVTSSQLEDWGVLTRVGKKLAPTYAYALLVGWRKFGGLVQCGVFRGKTKATFIDHREYSGSVIDQIDSAYDYLRSKINVGLEIVGTKSVDRYEIPLDALRELVINAIVHRSYVNPRAMSVQVALFDDRLDVITPGGIPHGMSIRLIEEGHSLSRNRALALACKYMRIIESWGSGILRIQEMLREAGLAPLRIQDNGIDVVFSIQRRARGNQGETVNETVSETVNETVSETVKTSLLNAIRENPGIGSAALKAAVGKSRATVMRELAELKRQRLVVHRGSDKTGGYFVV